MKDDKGAGGSQTRWQLRVNKDLEKFIREMSETEQRSINKTVIFILEKYRREHDKQKTKNT